MLVLQHCRGAEQINCDSDTYSDSDYETDGAFTEAIHRMVSSNILVKLSFLKDNKGKRIIQIVL